jgi:hypothetical protein
LGEILRSQAVTREAAKLRVIEGGPAKDAFRDEIVRELASFRLQPEQCRGARFDDLVHWLKQYERNPWTPEAATKARKVDVDTRKLDADARKRVEDARRVLKAEFADYFGRRRPRPYWSLMARMIAHSLRELLREAGQPRLTFGTDTGPMIRFICHRLDRILEKHQLRRPKHDAVFRMLKKSNAPARRRRLREAPKTPPAQRHRIPPN